MRLTSSNLLKSFDVAMAAGFGTEKEIDFALDSDEAIIIRQVYAALDNTSGNPFTNAAGIYAFFVALAAKSQAVPANILELSELFALVGIDGTVSAGGGISPFWPDHNRGQLHERLTRGVFVHSYTANITNAATTVVRMTVRYDRYTITSAEKVLLL